LSTVAASAAGEQQNAREEARTQALRILLEHREQGIRLPLTNRYVQFVAMCNLST
jgi:hypothetical protein